MCKKLWLIGTGEMSSEYMKVLQSLDVQTTVIGRGEKSAKLFEDSFNCRVERGGLEKFISSLPEKPDMVINAVGIEALTKTTELLLKYGIKRILLEKPGFGDPKETKVISSELTNHNNTQLFIAYNRRFYQSILEAKEIIKKDGGIRSFHFEFTELSYRIEELLKTKVELNNWFYGNSTHLIDTAFYLAGQPEKIFSNKKGGLSWHPNGEIYTGMGETRNGASFTYIANWGSPGKWGLQLCTKNYRIILEPLERLKIIEYGSLKISEPELDYSLDTNFKPGLYLQTKAFLENDDKSLLTFRELLKNLNSIYNPINKMIL